LIDLEVLEDNPIITEKLGDVLDEGEVVRPPSKLRRLNIHSHPAEELDVERGTVELLKLVDGIFEPVEPSLRILEKVPSIRIRNEAFRLPPMIDSVEARALNVEDGREKTKHVTVQVMVN
jgi:hypothetical protein